MNMESQYLTRVIANPARAFSTQIKASDFEIEEYGLAFEELKRQVTAGGSPSIASIAAALPNQSYAIGLLTPATDNEIDTFESMMIERAINLRARRVGEEIKTRLDRGEMSETFLPWLMQAASYCAVGNNSTTLTTFYDYAMEFGPIIEERYRNKGKVLGIPSGFSKLDEYIGGFQPAVYFIGARPSQGKTALLVSMLRYAANKGHKVAMISLESSAHSIIGRVLSGQGPIEMNNLKTGNLKENDFNSLHDSFETIKGWNGYLVFDPKAQLSSLEQHCTTLVKAGGAEIIFIDYLQRIQGPGSMVEKVGAASRAITDLSRTLNVPIVCLAQTGRQADNEAPSLSHFQHNSSIEQDADVGMIIYHTTVGDGPDAKHQSYLKILKNRDGDIGDVPVFFDTAHVRFLTEGEL